MINLYSIITRYVSLSQAKSSQVKWTGEENRGEERRREEKPAGILRDTVVHLKSCQLKSVAFACNAHYILTFRMRKNLRKRQSG